MDLTEETANELIKSMNRLSTMLSRLMDDSSSDSPIRTVRDNTRALIGHTDAMQNHSRRLMAHTEQMQQHGGALMRATMR